MSMTFSHFSRAETVTPFSVIQSRSHFKPDGLWVSVDGPDDWPSWCRAEEYGDIDSQNRFRVALADGPLVLDTAEAVLDFQREYAAPRWEGDDGVDWSRVAEDYPGIIIAPYQRSLRLGMLWYYGWDCASGCIWDASVITSVERVTEPEQVAS